LQLDIKELCNPLLKLYQEMEHIHALHHKLSHNMQNEMFIWKIVVCNHNSRDDIDFT
jgi:hypothetical protein